MSRACVFDFVSNLSVHYVKICTIYLHPEYVKRWFCKSHGRSSLICKRRVAAINVSSGGLKVPMYLIY